MSRRNQLMAMSVTYATVHGRLVEENRGGVVTEYVPDTLGNVIMTTNELGTVTSTTTYWPFGEVRTQTGTNPSPWGFCGVWGYLTDAVSRMYVRARHFRADTSRWLTLDPLWPSKDAYHYVRNTPTSLIDPTGLYEMGPDLGVGVPTWPAYQPWFWNYGNYCGLRNWIRAKPCELPPGISCLDVACKEHDECLHKANKSGGNNYWKPPGTSCNCKLLHDALVCYLLYCRNDSSSGHCRATKELIAAFAVICPVGFIGNNPVPPLPPPPPRCGGRICPTGSHLHPVTCECVWE
ncbi:MAG: RHS repeat domain-containing protein [Armatimonadota bacterium]